MAIKDVERDRKAHAEAIAAYEIIVLKIVRRYLKKHVKKVVAYVKINGTENVPIDTLLDKTVWRDLMPKIYVEIGVREAKREYYNQRRLDGQEQKASILGMLIDVWSGKLRDFALRYAYQFETSLSQTTVELIERALGRDYAMGLDSSGRVRLFLKDMKDMINNRSKPITRTETTTVAAIGKEIGARQWIEQTGEEGYRLWFGRADERERPEHVALNDTIIPLNENYNMAGFTCERPGDTSLPKGLRINCRCSESFMTAGRYRQYVKRGLIVNGKVIG